MRTLAVMHLSQTTGPARTLYPRLEALAARGSLDTLVPAAGPVARRYGRIGEAAVCPYTTLTLPRSPRAAARTCRALARDVSLLRARIRLGRPDLVVVATSTLPAALLAARLERVPAIVYVAEVFDRGRLQRLLGRMLLRCTVLLADAVVCCSESVARQLRPSGGRVVTIAPGIGEPAAPARAAARRRFGVPDEALCVAVVGSISAGRGQDVAIRSLARVLDAQPDARLLLAGVPHPRPVDRAYRGQLERSARELGLDGHVIFAGAVDPVDDVYAAADVVAVPARVDESFGRVAFEALAAGRPVVATPVGAVRDLLAHEREVLLVDRDDPASLARAVLRLQEDPELAERLVERGRAVVRDRLAEGPGVDAFVRIAEDVVAARRALPPPRFRMGGSHFASDHDFVAGALRDVSLLESYAGLTADSEVLDLGCGAGRLAVGLRERFGTIRRYVGVDVQEPLVRWAARFLGTDPSFSFRFLDAANARYNPAGTAPPRLPVGSRSFDVAYAYSVFSHLAPAEMPTWLGELRRALRPTGRALFTAFVEPGDFEPRVNPSDYGELAWSGPLHCVLVSSSRLDAMLASVGFRIEHLSAHTETDGQSLIVLAPR